MSEPIAHVELLVGKEKAVLRLKKHLSPTVFSALILKLPLSSYAIRLGDLLVIRVGIAKADVPKVKDIEDGDVIYDPMQDSLIVYLSSDQKKAGRWVKLGEVIKGLENLKSIQKSSPAILRELKGSTK